MFKFLNLIFLSSMVVIQTDAQTISQPKTTNSIMTKSSIIEEGASLNLISGQFAFTEGPATDSKGNIFFTDQPNNKIWEYGIDGKLSLFMDNAGRSNGMFFDRQGNLITCADEHNQLWKISPDKKVTVLLKDFEGLHFNGPNDVWVNLNEDIYFTDPYYQRDYWTRKSPEIQGQKVYCFRRDKQTIIVADNLVQPNGIIGSPDGKYLYVADIGGNKTYKYTIAEDGTLKDQKLAAAQGSDGMTLDDKGNIYLTGKGVTVYDNEGKLIEHIDVPEEWTANVTFGGKKGDQLFITASHSLYVMQMKVKGVN